MAGHEGEEVFRRVAGEGGFGEMRVFRNEPVRRGVDIGEIASPAAGNAHFLGRFGRVIDDEDFETRLSHAAGAEESGRAGAEHDGIKGGRGRCVRHGRPMQQAGPGAQA